MFDRFFIFKKKFELPIVLNDAIFVCVGALVYFPTPIQLILQTYPFA